MYKIEDGKTVILNKYYKHPCISNYHLSAYADLIADGWIDGELPVVELTLDQTITNKIYELKNNCEQAIYQGFDSDCLGETKHFDCEVYDQADITGLALTALLGSQGLTTEETHWKATSEKECYNFEYAQILQLAIDMKKHRELNINKFNTLRLQVEACLTNDEVSLIEW